MAINTSKSLFLAPRPRNKVREEEVFASGSFHKKLRKTFFLLVSAFLKIQFLHFRDLTLHQNRWHCDCHLLALHNWLQNFTVPNSVEPRCHSPPRLINEPIKALAPTEFACIPKVSPTSMYLEVIEGKNMSLVCTIEVCISLFLLVISDKNPRA